jgi:hypothetical protein
VLKLPLVQFNKKSYAEAKKWIEEAGGSWQGGKVQGFTFPFNADRVFSILHEGKRTWNASFSRKNTKAFSKTSKIAEIVN